MHQTWGEGLAKKCTCAYNRGGGSKNQFCGTYVLYGRTLVLILIHFFLDGPWSYKKTLKELQNCILGIIGVRSLFCSIQAYVSLHFLLILLVKLEFRLCVFWFFMFPFLWFLGFIFSVLCYDLKVISKYFITFFSFFLTLFKRSVKYKNCFIKNMLLERFVSKENAIYKEKICSVYL